MRLVRKKESAMPGSAVEQRDVEQRDVAARWTPHLASGGFTPIVDFFLDHYRELGITNLEAMFLVHLIRFKWTSQMPFPGFKRLAKTALSQNCPFLGFREWTIKG
jgi:hypothetical protein